MTVELNSKHTSDDVDDSIVAGHGGCRDSLPTSDQAERKTEAYYPKGWQQPVLGSSFNHTFESWWQTRGSLYEQAVVAGGGTPWVCDPERRAAVVEALGLPDDNLDDIALRRALWERRHKDKEIR